MASKFCAFIFLMATAGFAQTVAPPRHFIVLDPQHGHASAVFEQSIPGVSNTVHVYAPAGHAVSAFLESLQAFNHRSKNPTAWRVESHITPDFLQSALHEPPGNIVVITSRNDLKIGYISACLRAGQNVLADKPWIINAEDFPSLKASLQIANEKHLAFYDGMTERFNIAYQIQRDLMRDPDLFGHPLTGTASQPAVELKNVHSLVKFNENGEVNIRPSWFLDVHKQGEAIADVGTHLVDLEMATLFPNQAIEYQRDVKVLAAMHSPIMLTLPQFQRLTHEKEWPADLQGAVHDNQLQYLSNSTATYTLRGIYTSITDQWEYESRGALSDTYLVVYRGTRGTIRVEQSGRTDYIPEIDVLPAAEEGNAPGALAAALKRRLESLQGTYPHLSFHDNGGALRLVVPKELRARGGSTFAQLVNRFLGYVQNPQSLPHWEESNLLAKYYVTTSAARLADK